MLVKEGILVERHSCVGSQWLLSNEIGCEGQLLWRLYVYCLYGPAVADGARVMTRHRDIRILMVWTDNIRRKAVLSEKVSMGARKQTT